MYVMKLELVWMTTMVKIKCSIIADMLLCLD